jgi:hypothetical protein
MECYSALKRKNILTHATTCMSLKDIMLSKISHLTKSECSVIPFIQGTYIVKLIETESKTEVARGWNYCLMSTELSYGMI